MSKTKLSGWKLKAMGLVMALLLVTVGAWAQQDLAECTIDLGTNADALVYDGNGHEPAVVGLAGTGCEGLVVDADFAVSYSANLDASAVAQVIVTAITGSGAMNGTSHSRAFTIAPAAIGTPTIVLGAGPYTFNGATPVNATVTSVTHATLGALAATDYSVAFTNNTSAGTATATFTFSGGNYTGANATATYAIAPAAIGTPAIVLATGPHTFAGSAIEPAVTSVTHTTNGVVAATNYDVVYTNNINVGTGVATFAFKGNYSGTATANFTIVAASLASATVDAGAGPFVFTGSAHTPTPTVTLGSGPTAVTLVAGVDYNATIGYSANTNQGTATMTVTGMGNYLGSSATGTFTIARADVATANITVTGSTVLNTGSISPAITVTMGGNTLVATTDYTAAYTNNSAVGTGTVTITGVGNYTGTAPQTFTITADPTAVVAAVRTALAANAWSFIRGKNECGTSVTLPCGAANDLFNSITQVTRSLDLPWTAANLSGVSGAPAGFTALGSVRIDWASNHARIVVSDNDPVGLVKRTGMNLTTEPHRDVTLTATISFGVGSAAVSQTQTIVVRVMAPVTPVVAVPPMTQAQAQARFETFIEANELLESSFNANYDLALSNLITAKTLPSGLGAFNFSDKTIEYGVSNLPIEGTFLGNFTLPTDVRDLFSTLDASHARVEWIVVAGSNFVAATAGPTPTPAKTEYFEVNPSTGAVIVKRPSATEGSQWVRLEMRLAVNPTISFGTTDWGIPAVAAKPVASVTVKPVASSATAISVQGGTVTLDRSFLPLDADVAGGWVRWEIEPVGDATLSMINVPGGTGGFSVVGGMYVGGAGLNSFAINANTNVNTGGGNGSFIVRAITGCAIATEVAGEFTLVVSQQLTAPKVTAVGGLIGVSPGVASVLATWDPPEAITLPVTGYQVRLYTSTGTQVGSMVPRTPELRNVTFTTGVVAGNSYYVTVQAQNSANGGTTGPIGRSATITVTGIKEEVANGNDWIIYSNWDTVYTGLVQNMRQVNRASLRNSVMGIGLPFYTQNGLDPFVDTIYTYAEITNGVPGSYFPASATFPRAAGTYAARVRFENSQYFIQRDLTRMTIARRDLNSRDVTVELNTDIPRTYDGIPKYPEYRVMHGTSELVYGTHFTGVVGGDSAYFNNLNAGEAFLRIVGTGNYAGTVSRPFNILRRPITIKTEDVVIGAKAYDGTTAIPAGLSVTVPYETNLTWGETDHGCTPVRFTLSSGSYSTPNATDNAGISGSNIGLNWTDECSNNYTITGATNNRLAFNRANGLTISRITATAAHFNSTNIVNLLYNGQRRPFANVGWVTPFNNGPNNPPQIRYIGSGYDSTVAPVEVGIYGVYAVISDAGGPANFINDPRLLIKNFTISEKLKADWVRHPEDYTVVRQGEGALTLSAEAVRPMGETGSRITSGTISYQWLRNDTAITGATSASYTWTAPISREAIYEFKLRAIYTNNQAPYVQAPDTTESNVGRVLVLPAARSLSGARIILHEGQEMVYHGDEHKPTFDVELGTGSTRVPLTYGVDYDFVYLYNINAGTGIIEISGLRNQLTEVNAYFGTARGSFTIQKRPLYSYDVEMVNAGVVPYNRAPQSVQFRATDGRTGLGTPTVTYDGSLTAPTNVGEYAISVTFTEGTNFFASEGAFDDRGIFEIVRKVIDTSDVDFAASTFQRSQSVTLDSGVVEIDPIEVLVSDVVLRGSGHGNVTILYSDRREMNTRSETAPTTVGNYAVLLGVEGGSNYLQGVVEIGDITISPWTSVKEIEQVVRGDEGVAIVNPVTRMSAVFTAGPNPVSKNAGSVAFFWQGKAINSSNLSVFTATGALVAKVNVSDLGTSTARREVGSWNLRDTKGNQVSEGTYLIRGVVTGKDGSKERVSYKVNVR